jgi:DNA-directed RNA polymerase III subunit RPC4
LVCHIRRTCIADSHYFGPIQNNIPFDDDQLYFFQLPAVLPRFKLSKPEAAEQPNSTTSETQPAAADKKQAKENQKIPTVNDAEFDQAQEGRIGSLMVYKSGKVKMKVGSVYLEVCVYLNIQLVAVCK